MQAFLIILAAFAVLFLVPAGVAQDASPSLDRVARQEVTVHPKLPPYVFEIEGKKPSTLTIRISGGPKSYRGQEITADVEDEKRPGFRVVDVNLDGYEDFAVINNRGATGNVVYSYWVFDPKAGVFKDADDFDEITDVDAVHGLLLSHSKGGNILTTTDYYRVRDGKPLVVKSIEVRWARDTRDVVPPSFSDDTPVKITRIYQNGRLRRTFYSRQVDD